MINYILEDDYRGEHFIFKDKNRGIIEMLKYYAEHFDEMYTNRIKERVDEMEISDYDKKFILAQFDSIQHDIYTAMNDSYIESFAYLYGAEVIE